MHQQYRQQRARLDASQRERARLAAHLERPQYPELHVDTLLLALRLEHLCCRGATSLQGACRRLVRWSTDLTIAPHREGRHACSSRRRGSGARRRSGSASRASPDVAAGTDVVVEPPLTANRDLDASPTTANHCHARRRSAVRTPAVIEIVRPRAAVTRDTFIDCWSGGTSAHAPAVASEIDPITASSSSARAYLYAPDLAAPGSRRPDLARTPSR
ncbi:MAG: hypothetical protein QOJ63_40 [Solirubrobacteraceae bacterium]|jgi:hypothetical protein|nr:hypothetical protein [Solirubrobacteraceae bacterium]